jgi:hypothetical protein
MCQGAAPLPLLTHKWAATRVGTASTCRSYLLAFNAHLNRIFRGRTVLHLLPHRPPILVRVLCRLYLVMHMLRRLCVGKTNGHCNCEQRDSDDLQHGASGLPARFDCSSARKVQLWARTGNDLFAKRPPDNN